MWIEGTELAHDEFSSPYLLIQNVDQVPQCVRISDHLRFIIKLINFANPSDVEIVALLLDKNCLPYGSSAAKVLPGVCICCSESIEDSTHDFHWPSKAKPCSSHGNIFNTFDAYFLGSPTPIWIMHKNSMCLAHSVAMRLEKLFSIASAFRFVLEAKPTTSTFGTLWLSKSWLVFKLIDVPQVLRCHRPPTRLQLTAC